MSDLGFRVEPSSRTAASEAKWHVPPGVEQGRVGQV